MKRRSVVSLVLALMMILAWTTSALATDVVDTLPGDPVVPTSAEIDMSALEMPEESEPLEFEALPQEEQTLDAGEVTEVDMPEITALLSKEEGGKLRAAPTTRAGQYTINQNTINTHSLASATDYNIYICQVTGAGDAAVFLDNPSGMDFGMQVQVIDASFSVVKYQSVSTLPRAVNGGRQRVRLPVQTGEYVVLVVEPGANFVAGNTYDFGVVLAPTNASEPNDQPESSLHMGVTDATSTVASSEMDNPLDVDWFRFDHNDKTSYPSVAFASDSTNIKAALYEMVGGTLTKVADLTNNDGSWQTLERTQTTTYYLAIYATNLTMGNYMFGFESVKIYLHDRQISISWVVSGDTYDPKIFGGEYRETIRSRSRGTVTMEDSEGNPIPNFPYALTFDSIYNGASGSPLTIGVAQYTTAANGTGSAAITIDQWPYNHMGWFLDMEGYEIYLYCPARINIFIPDGFYNIGVVPTMDVWQYGGVRAF